MRVSLLLALRQLGMVGGKERGTVVEVTLRFTKNSGKLAGALRSSKLINLTN